MKVTTYFSTGLPVSESLGAGGGSPLPSYLSIQPRLAVCAGLSCGAVWGGYGRMALLPPYGGAHDVSRCETSHVSP